MVWTRRLAVPVEPVWEAISTKEGLSHWWMQGSPNEIDLRIGGLLQHHWKSTITDFKENEYIALESETGFGFQRFQLSSDGDGTVFAFRELMTSPPNPALYAAPAGGYHAMIDALEMHLTGKKFELGAKRDAMGRPPEGSYEDDLVKFYKEHLAT